LGIWLKHKQSAIGLSSFQIPNPRLRPLNQEFVLDRYWNLNAYNKLDIYDGYYLTSHGYVRLQPDINPQLTAASILTMFHHVDFGGSYWHQKGIALLAGIKEINLFGGNANFLVSYFYDTRKWSSPGSGVIELTLGYGFLNEKKKAEEQPSEE
jgi:Type IX secretion system membrane protein PorP/SprF